jgi:dephospho-CoA kinase
VTRRIALTGGIATGKSHVRAQFEALGVPTIDADVLSRQAVEPGTPGHAAIVDRFGERVLDATGALDRRRLGAIVFADPQARRDLELIVHPFVRRAIDDWFASLERSRQQLGIADIPLLYETGRQADFDAVIVAACDPRTQLARVSKRDQLTESEAQLRIDAQMPIEEKVRLATHVIRTDGPFAATERQVRAVLELLLSERG